MNKATVILMDIRPIASYVQKTLCMLNGEYPHWKFIITAGFHDRLSGKHLTLPEPSLDRNSDEYQTDKGTLANLQNVLMDLIDETLAINKIFSHGTIEAVGDIKIADVTLAAKVHFK